jgi:transposase-like protein
MPHRGRLTVEEKVRIVEAYKTGKLGATAIHMQDGIGWTTLRSWVQRYELRGAIGLAETSRNRKYEPELKREAVQAYLNGSGSLSDTLRLKIS